MSLLKYVPDKVKGFEVKRITSVSGIYVVDKNGYIGIKINDYFSQNGSPYPGNYALVAKGPDYSNLGLGQVTFLEDAIGSVTIGDKTYRTVIMPDGKEWMAENLDFCPEGIILRTSSNWWVSNNNISQASYYNYDEQTYGWNGMKYGLLYSWAAAKSLTIAGWHLPSVAEFEALNTAIGGNAARKIKSTTGWSESGNGTDNYRFSLVPAGQYSGSFFYGVSSYGDLQTSDEYQSNTNCNSYLNIVNSSSGSLYCNWNPKYYGHSIRLVRDTVA